MQQYPRDYLAWCFDGADPELSVAMKEKHYDLMLADMAQLEAQYHTYCARLTAIFDDSYYPHEFEPVPQYQLDTDHITNLLGVLS